MGSVQIQNGFRRKKKVVSRLEKEGLLGRITGQEAKIETPGVGYVLGLKQAPALEQSPLLSQDQVMGCILTLRCDLSELQYQHLATLLQSEMHTGILRNRVNYGITIMPEGLAIVNGSIASFRVVDKSPSGFARGIQDAAAEMEVDEGYVGTNNPSKAMGQIAYLGYSDNIDTVLDEFHLKEWFESMSDD